MAMWWYPHSLVYRVTKPPTEGFLDRFTVRSSLVTGHPGCEEDADEEAAVVDEEEEVIAASVAPLSPVEGVMRRVSRNAPPRAPFPPAVCP